LLEVLVAVAVLATAGLAVVATASESVRAIAFAETRERELADEERLLAAYTLLAKADLDGRLGTLDAGRYVVRVERPEAQLYRISVRRTEAPHVEDLVTVVYRAEVRGAP
jgi:hypothetical protein